MIAKIIEKLQKRHVIQIFFLFFILLLTVTSLYYIRSTNTFKNQAAEYAQQKNTLSQQLTSENTKVRELENTVNYLTSQDQYLINKQLEADIKQIETTYAASVAAYEGLLDMYGAKVKTDKLEKQYADIVTLLSKRNYVSASAQLVVLKNEIEKTKQTIASSFSIPENVAANNAPPGAGYRRQRVDADIGSYLVDIVAADLSSTRVVIDTASDADCRDNCPVLPLGDFVARSGGFAGINGPYFCPASYPSCAGKANSFDTLMMNKNKKYFNSDNNVYSSVPAVIFSGGSARFVGASSEWGRDTSPDAVIASQPMLLSGGNVVFGGDGEVKRAGKGSRSFIGTKGSTVYIGVVHNASVAEVARVLKTLGLEYALNLDSGGSTALMSGGRYVAGPGRALPFGIVLVRR